MHWIYNWKSYINILMVKELPSQRRRNLRWRSKLRRGHPPASTLMTRQPQRPFHRQWVHRGWSRPQSTTPPMTTVNHSVPCFKALQYRFTHSHYIAKTISHYVEDVGFSITYAQCYIHICICICTNIIYQLSIFGFIEVVTNTNLPQSLRSYFS